MGETPYPCRPIPGGLFPASHGFAVKKTRLGNSTFDSRKSKNTNLKILAVNYEQ
jgi:hypothetical protein